MRNYILFLLFILHFPAIGKVIYVKSNATGPNDGTSWTKAFTQVRDAINNASPYDEIWISSASKTLTSEFSTIQLKNKIKIYGGFNGNEISLSQRGSGKSFLDIAAAILFTANGLDSVVFRY